MWYESWDKSNFTVIEVNYVHSYGNLCLFAYGHLNGGEIIKFGAQHGLANIYLDWTMWCKWLETNGCKPHQHVR